MELIVYKSPYSKLRLGNPNGDGGYVIADLPTIKDGTGYIYDHFISGGIGKDMSFEKDIVKLYKNVRCDAFDETISSLPDSNETRIKFHKKNLGNGKDNTCNLNTEMKKYENIFLKIDIEGNEYDLLKSIIENNNMNKIKQLVIEWHTYADIILHPIYFKNIDKNNSTHEIMFSIMNTINKTHKLIHFHPNNCPKLHLYNSIIIPNVFECTYIRNDDSTYIYELNNDTIPSILDRPNMNEFPEVRLSGYPYNTRNDISWFTFYK